MGNVRDVARRAGVSVGTVSRVLNGAPNVGSALQLRVEQAVEELGYRPNALARSLRQQRSRTVGLVIPDITNPYLAELARAVEAEAAAVGYCVILGNSMESPRTQHMYLETLAGRRVDGIIVVVAVGTTMMPLLPGIPLVFLDRDAPGTVGDTAAVVTSDNYGGAVTAVTHLWQLGHRRIAFIGGPRNLSVAAARSRGYGAALAAQGVPLREDLVWHGAFDYFTGYHAAEHFLALPQRPTAIFASSDQQAIGVLRALIDAGVHVPTHMSVIGFDDVLLAQLAIPRLTTVSQPVAALGATAVRVLLEDGPPQPRQVVLDVALVVRETTAPPAAADHGHIPRPDAAAHAVGQASLDPRTA